ncbi:CAP domain-containing protein [Nakamurella alba]|nr:CAP domain-containing protein [Nakamurella alba]
MTATLLRRARAVLLTLLLSAVAVLGMSTASAAPAAAGSAPTRMTSFDAELVALINRARQAKGLNPVLEAKGLVSTALGWSQKMATGQSGGQLLRNPNAWEDVARTGGASNRTMWGENIAMATSVTATPQQVFDAYMASPAHEANILSSKYKYVGTATVTGTTGIWSTTEFTDLVQSGQSVAAPTAKGSLSYRDGSKAVGAVSFEIRDAACKSKLGGWTTPSSGTVSSSAAPATYCVVTTKVPAGYKVPAQQKFVAYWGQPFTVAVPLTK